MHGAQVYADLVPENDQEISLSDMVLYAREHLGLAVACMTAGPNNLAMRPLGVAYNTLKLEAGYKKGVSTSTVRPRSVSSLLRREGLQDPWLQDVNLCDVWGS